MRQTRELQPDLVLLDISLPGLNGLEAAKQISVVSPKSKVVFLTLITDPNVVDAALSTGALGYILKSDLSRLFDALEAIRHGEKFVSPALREKGPID